MKIDRCAQLSPEWWDLKKGKISGTRFGQVISGRDNRLLFDLLDERMNEHLFPDGYESEEMEFGTENEPIALEKYEAISGIKFESIGAILSDYSPIHMASPDGINMELGIVAEVKCTQDGGIHIQRFFDGPESSHMPQIINYFAQSVEVKQVHWISYCPFRPERPLVFHIFTPESIIGEDKKARTIQSIVEEGRGKIKEIESKLDEMYNKFIF